MMLLSGSDHENSALALNVEHSLQGQPHNGVEIADASRASRIKWMAASAKQDCRQTGLYISKEQTGCFCRWMFLAWMPQMLSSAFIKSQILGCESSAKQKARFAAAGEVAARRMECA